ncbi:hypothetical protein C84B14_10762 [Salinisphaera sp. C84B14]|uniref:7-cyano-7-deazaguanine/7-aminomethyl-7- deazaguanine transporter n=1 Tax=Salinisphaera sp. C84B14 TaxID=1304155 RepID=UPI0033427436
MSLSLSGSQWRRVVLVLACLHVLVIAASNYLVQLPFTLFGWHTTWGAFSFPFIFLVSDLTVRLLGGATARRVVAAAMAPALVVSYLLSVLYVDGRFAGLDALAEFDTLVARIALASFCAYLFGQLLDIGVFQRLRRLRQWWVAPTASTLFGNALDTLLFFSIAFAGSSNGFMAEHWLEIACVDYAFKLLISLGLFLPLYGALLALLSRYLLTATASAPARGQRVPDC